MSATARAAYGPDYEAEARAAKLAAQGLTAMHAAAAAGNTQAVLQLGEEDEKLGWAEGRSVQATNSEGGQKGEVRWCTAALRQARGWRRRRQAAMLQGSHTPDAPVPHQP